MKTASRKKKEEARKITAGMSKKALKRKFKRQPLSQGNYVSSRKAGRLPDKLSDPGCKRNLVLSCTERLFVKMKCLKIVGLWTFQMGIVDITILMN